MTQWLLLQNFREIFLFFGCFATWNHVADFVFNLHGRHCSTPCSTRYVTPGSPRNICKHKLIVIVFAVSFLWLETVLWICDISARIRIRILGSVQLTYGPDPDPAFFVSGWHHRGFLLVTGHLTVWYHTAKEGTGHLHQSSKIKS